MVGSILEILSTFCLVWCKVATEFYKIVLRQGRLKGEAVLALGVSAMDLPRR